MNKVKYAAPLINKLVEQCCSELNIQRPVVKLVTNPQYASIHKSFGGYMPGQNMLKVSCVNRNLADVLRSISHEIYHSYQDQNGLLENGAGKDGDKWENEANSYAGVIMRKFGRENPEIYDIVL